MLPEMTKREYGRRKKTEDALSTIPIPSTNEQELPPIPQQPQQQALDDIGYELSDFAQNPLATLPVDAQNGLIKAKAIYELGAHPGATIFETELANILFNDLHQTDQSTENQKEQKNRNGKKQE